MLNQYEPNVKAVIRFLDLLKVKVTITTVNETLQNHPDWPSLLCITDSLNKWHIPNGAGKIDPTEIDALPTPFIAHTGDAEFPLVIVSEVSANSIKQFSNGYIKEEQISRDAFLSNWNGVYLLAEPDSHSGEKNYRQSRNKEIILSLLPIAAFILMVVLSTAGIFNNLAGTQSQSSPTAIAIFIQYLVSLTGVFVTTLLLWYEIDKSNPLLQKVCTGIAKGNCNAILTGKAAKVFSWLSWSEVGFFYFTGAVFLLLFTRQNMVTTFTLIGWLNLLALPYTVFSVYYQWKVAKQWCVLCLIVQALLLLGGINAVASNALLSWPQITFLHVVNYLLLLALPALLWFVAKPYILRLQQAKNTKREYLRIKFNAEIFETLLKKQKSITISPEGLGIDIGNPGATNTIIKVCNPYCGPCATAHPKMESLLEQNNNVKAKIIFATPNNEDYPSIKPIRHLLAIAEGETNQLRIKQSLDDWYLPEKKEYEKFATRYPVNGELNKQGKKIDAMNNWCNATGIAFTPTFFINGYQLPDGYDIEDLKYFLLE